MLVPRAWGCAVRMCNGAQGVGLYGENMCWCPEPGATQEECVMVPRVWGYTGRMCNGAQSVGLYGENMCWCPGRGTIREKELKSPKKPRIFGEIMMFWDYTKKYDYEPQETVDFLGLR